MIDWLLIGRDGIDFDNIDLYIQTNGTKIDYIGIDKYMNGITINNIVIQPINENLENHIKEVIELRTSFYGI